MRNQVVGADEQLFFAAVEGSCRQPSAIHEFCFCSIAAERKKTLASRAVSIVGAQGAPFGRKSVEFAPQLGRAYHRNLNQNASFILFFACAVWHDEC
jgi:thermostable 8-oxoguanine DNA glycosylase